MSPSRADPSRAGGHPFSAAPARGTGALNTGRGAPLVVPLECLVLGVLPVSVLHIVVTPLGAVACFGVLAWGGRGEGSEGLA